MYTGGQKKPRYNIACLLFFKMLSMFSAHIVVVNVVFENDCKIWTAFSEADFRQVDSRCLHDFYDSSTSGYIIKLNNR